MKRAKLTLAASMLIYGSVGLFVREAPCTSAQTAFARAIVGCVFLFVFGGLIRRRISWNRIRPNLKFLILVGVCVGINWILLFQAYQYTTIPTATVCYYFAPVIVMLLSPVVLKERLTPVKVLCILAAAGGMFLVAGVEAEKTLNLLGIAYGLAAAVFYGASMLLSKFLKNITGLECAFVQLLAAAIVLAPYALLGGGVPFYGISIKGALILLILGIVHTGVAYQAYFTAVQRLKGQTIAAFSYLDPVSAIFMAWIFLGETMAPLQLAGGILVLGAAFFSEYFKPRSEASS